MFDLERMAFLDALKPILPWPMWLKAAVVAGTAVLVLVLYWLFGWMPIQDEIAQQQARVQQEEIRYRKNLRLAKDLPKKRQEYNKLKKQLAIALAMLPKKSQIPDLLEQVSFVGKEAGLEFAEFKPMGERPQKIYAEVPVSLKMSGTFRQLMLFLKKVGELPRIVNVRGLAIEKRENALQIAGEAVTYRFLEAKQKPKRPRRGRRR